METRQRICTLLILAAFRANSVQPVMAGPLPEAILPLVLLPLEDARSLYEEMIGNTANYLTEYKNI